jgi:hypothetical protein
VERSGIHGWTPIAVCLTSTTRDVPD